ncbi:hypothetical protein J4457_01385 [Candidatus Woesearchaeota archaeon]|nr:hypothetical protein [Candidatus Woesearchaeota archaeon]
MSEDLGSLVATEQPRRTKTVKILRRDTATYVIGKNGAELYLVAAPGILNVGEKIYLTNAMPTDRAQALADPLVKLVDDYIGSKECAKHVADSANGRVVNPNTVSVTSRIQEAGKGTAFLCVDVSVRPCSPDARNALYAAIQKDMPQILSGYKR